MLPSNTNVNNKDIVTVEDIPCQSKGTTADEKAEMRQPPSNVLKEAYIIHVCRSSFKGTELKIKLQCYIQVESKQIKEKLRISK